jgi:general secretion pathway protein I
MVALAIVALGMMAVNTQLNRYVLSTVFIEQKTLASWIASNVLTELSVDSEWPAIGERRDEVEFAQRQWVWEAEISETPVENLRRVDVTVSLVAGDNSESEIHTMSGFLEPPPPRGFVPINWASGGTGFRNAAAMGAMGMAGSEADEPVGMGAGN